MWEEIRAMKPVGEICIYKKMASRKDKSYLNILVLSDRFVAKKMEVDGISAVSFFLWQHFRIMYCSSIFACASSFS